MLVLLGLVVALRSWTVPSGWTDTSERDREAVIKAFQSARVVKLDWPS